MNKNRYTTDIAEWLKKFDDVQWVKSYGDRRILGLIPNGRTIEFSISTELAKSHYDMDSLPVQLVAMVKIDGVPCGKWGCMSNEGNAKLVKWFTPAETSSRMFEHKADNQARAKVERLFDCM
jgi:hypothetical protein